MIRRPGVFVRKYLPSLACLLIGASLDTATTIVFMLQTSPSEEMHPVVRAAAEVFGVWVGMVLATVGRLMFVLLVAGLWRRWCNWVLGICALLYVLAAGSNHFGWLGSIFGVLGWY